MEPIVDKKPTRQLATLEGKVHIGAEIPKEEQTMAGTVAGKAARRAFLGATGRTVITVDT